VYTRGDCRGDRRGNRRRNDSSDWLPRRSPRVYALLDSYTFTVGYTALDFTYGIFHVSHAGRRRRRAVQANYA